MQKLEKNTYGFLAEIAGDISTLCFNKQLNYIFPQSKMIFLPGLCAEKKWGRLPTKSAF